MNARQRGSSGIPCRAYASAEELVLTAEGEREMTQPAWRKLDDVIENLETSRTPPREGRNYARALRKLLARND